MANLSPYLQELGLSKSATAAITIALPLSGAFIGPTAGALSDRLRTRWGRRRPMILAAAILTIVFLGLLAWTEQFVHLFAACPGAEPCDDPKGNISKTTIALAIIWTLLVSIAVQPVQAGVRALMVDIAPADEQSRVSAWASRIQGSLAIFSFFASSLNLPDLPGLGRLTQFQALTCLNFITLGGTVLITCVFIAEKDSRRISLQAKQRSVKEVFRHIYQTVWHLPKRISGACKAQFSSWFAWFPLLYYTTTFIGELGTKDMEVLESPGDTLAQAGSLGSLSFAIVGFFFTLTLPVALPYVTKKLARRSTQAEADNEANDTSNFSSEPRSLLWLWLSTQPVLGLLLVLTLAAASQWQGIVLVALAGLPWAVTQWVPWAVIGYETSRQGLQSEEDEEDAADSQAGAILGVHNMAISLPQVLSGAVSSVTYKISEEAGSQVPTAWVLAISGVAAFVAAYLVKRVL
ncbi:hypothetical protein M409DRAFT_16375 [Zasmidium cellare ATCC 36951]|uniref:Major facilitator superfamily (MFS) profile domain-containing protein n=1 Tax=Zasmidium cellare ATCC 36951 TaxID=1080233 RepID=A0A6A6D789_ZASCE|nr:uncharacterized protein M409DRAFT_16375 [Zasmidium cellare ATCC 36951]KAF2174102.1 hypothetical protein M409DRAFT_16375 [Zasmidium cellare ATCC 36951]